MSCLDENTLAALMERSLPPEEMERVTAHLDTCSSCRKLVSAMASWYAPEPGRQRTATVKITPARLDLRVTQDEQEDEEEQLKTAVAPPRPGELEPGTRVDRYLLLRPIASGGMSVVFAAYDPELDRRLAIKFLRSLVREPADDARLLREAQAMARLSHPNVVQVHDVGVYGDRVFLAMELVEGGTLRHWLGQRRRSRAEVMEVLLGAGRGLAAAHKAGVVHRDFKPENVLVGDDGRARVMDFGLARAYRGSAILSLSQERASEGGMSLGQLTRPGMVMGTPGYMAPEQLAGGRGDARSDQFAFCCALYEGLAGARPFAGTSLDEYMASISSARAVKPLSPLVPARVRGAVMRGLSLDPAQRFSSMDELLDALRLPFWRRLDRKRQAMAGGALAVVVLLSTSLLVRAAGGSCGDPIDALEGAWDEPRREAVIAALGKASNEAAAEAVAEALDRYAGRWSRAFEAVCRAGPTRSPEEGAGARACLQRRRADLAAAAELLSNPDAPQARRAMSIATAAPLPDECQNPRPPPAPPPPKDEDRLPRLRRQVSMARAFLAIGRFKEALAALGGAAGEAAAAGDPALEPEALFVLARLQAAQATFAAAERTLYESIWAAERSRHDEQAARSWIALYRVVGAELQDEARARELRRHAEAAVARAGSPPLLAAELDQAQGVVLLSAGAPAAALHPLTSSLSALQQALGAEDPATVGPLEQYGEVQGQLGKLAEAERMLQAAVALAEHALGADHPRTASARVRLGTVRSQLGRHAEAVQGIQGALAVATAPDHDDPALAFRAPYALGEALRRAGRLLQGLAWQKEALKVAESVFGPGSPRAAASQVALGDVLRGLGEYEQALEMHQRASALNPLSAPALDGAATDLRMLGRAAEGVELHRRALALQERAVGKDHPELAPYLVGLGAALGAQGDHGGAVELHRRALQLLERAHGREHPRLRPALVAMASEQGALGDTAGALRALERAVALSSGKEVDLVAAEARFALARALAQDEREPRRAVALALEAKATYALAHNAREEERVSRWLSRQASR